MEIIIKLSQFLLSLSLLIILHELGHFIPAKLFKTRVEKFYLFFDVKYSLLKKKIGETEYGIGWLPLGGYVKISGMIDESMDKEQMVLPAKSWEFRSKPAWQRLIIMLGGVTVNFILAFIIYIGMAFTYGDSYLANADLKDGLLIENEVMIAAGFKTGDKILSIDDEKIKKFNTDMIMKIMMSKKVLIERNGIQKEIKMPIDFVDQLSKTDKKKPVISIRVPSTVSEVDPNSINKELKPKDVFISLNGQESRYLYEVEAILEKNKNKSITVTLIRNGEEKQIPIIVSNEGKIGVQFEFYKNKKQEFNFSESIFAGLQKGKEQLVSYGNQLKMIFSPETKLYKQVGGFAAIYKIFPSVWNWETFWSNTALLSIMLGVMNLLPIPALDGGHVMFLLYEIISGKKPSDKFLENAQIIGFVLLIALLLFANGNDIYKAFK
ncbi:RIP metalloprotease RseP [Flavobacterium sp. N1736]|uniref:RIP metalloprotease RseP n=1 Tax=Flavobacterium sp. N1736 TaxID=2986823 RepID=UPI0022241B4E|nr:RIP metalloprotease RseP [Flavobacterium sp. N1736]